MIECRGRNGWFRYSRHRVRVEPDAYTGSIVARVAIFSKREATNVAPIFLEGPKDEVRDLLKQLLAEVKEPWKAEEKPPPAETLFGVTIPAQSKSGHTPGPWVAEPEEASEHRGIAICAPANGWIVATITPEDDRQADEIDWANARLIAAAPDLLAALREYQKANRLHHDEEARLYELAEVAIAKAEGEDA
ncbi:MAG: hypothetical protein FJ128_14685 [Deltaproteobacteria bacterium]|nr:hypothetical protein [Deltaproteobacteria bacterium]MBM4289727.1 hypothetical protein [Deltaproteobacteria bacterium]